MKSVHRKRAASVRALSVTFSLLLCSASAVAQVATGWLSGYVTDPQGRPVAKAKVSAIDAAQRQERTGVTDAAGFYRIVSLDPATYEVTASAESLTSETASAEILVGSAARVDLRLALAVRKERVEVRGEADPLSAEAVAPGIVLDRAQVGGLPLNRRDFLQLALLAPGVAPPVEDSELSSRGAFAMHAGGAREDFNNFLLDGVDNNDPYVNRYVVQPPVDSIQEFRIATGTYTAEYGRNAGGQVNVVTRRGGNSWQGFAYEYLRNRALDARNTFDGSTKPEYIRNQFGGGAGGPIVRNRTYLFANADFLRERQGATRLVTVPGIAERGGDFSGSASAVVDPFTRSPFPGNRIPISRISATGSRVAALFPAPTSSAVAGNLLAQPVYRGDSSQASVRVDQILTEKDHLSGRYTYGLADLYEPFTEDPDTVPGYGDTVRDPAHNAMITYEHFFSPQLTNSLRAGFSRLSRALLPENVDVQAADTLAAPWLAGAEGYPMFTVAGYSKIGDATSLPLRRHSMTYQLADTVAYVRGTHFLKAGGEVRYLQLNSKLDLLTRGSLSFSGAISGAGMSDLLLGFPTFGLRSVSDNPITMRSAAYNLFVQDDWRIRPGLTLYYGLRYEYNTPPVDAHDRMSTLDWSTGKLVQAGTNGVSRSGLTPDRNNFAPRVGFAWSAAPQWTVRGGYGVYFDTGSFMAGTSNYFNPPQFTLRVYFPTATSLLSLANPFPSQGGYVPPASLSLLSPDLVTASLQHWSATLQRNVTASGVLTIGYAGSKGTHLIRSRDINQPPPGPGDVQARRPYRSFGNMLLAESGANSSYQSLQTAYQTRLRRYGSVWLAYTFSKSIDDASAFLSTRGDKNFPQDSSHANLERGLSSFDLPHRLVASYIVPLPRWGVWTRNTEFRGIAVAESGRPLTPMLQFDNSNTGNTGGNFGSDRPNVFRNPKLGSPTPARWFDTSAFAVPTQYQFGNAGRNIVRGPGYFSFDLAVAREFALHDRAKVSVEAQAFNLFNRANYNLPSPYADAPTTFGRIFSAGAARQIQFALRLAF